MNRFLIAAAGLLGLAAATTVAASPAAAGPAPGSFTLASAILYPNATGTLVNGSARCPAGYRMLGSGVVGDYATQSAVQELAPNADFTGATVAMTSTGPVQLRVMCAPVAQFADVTVAVLDDHRVTPGTFARGLVQCPAGRYAFGGGGYFADGAGRRVTGVADNVSNTPSADGTAWTYSGVTPPGASRLDLITQCAPRTGHDVIVQSGTPAMADQQLVRAFAICPPGALAIAGGFYASNPDGSETTPASVRISAMGADPYNPGESIIAWQALGNVPYNTKLVALVQCLRP